MCECNTCVCEHGYTGKTCGECPSCPTTCQLLAACAECLAFGTGKVCGENCLNVTWELVKTMSELGPRCTESGSHGNVIEFTFTEIGLGKHLVILEQEFEDRRLAIVCGVTAGIFLVGLFILLLFRFLMEVKDRREFHRFLVEKEKSKWESGNPLFQSATTTTMNPNFLPD